MSKDLESEPQLLKGLRAGDAAAFDAVYAAEKARVYGFFLRLSGDPQVAADLFQNVWLNLAKNAERLRPDTHLRAWPLTVARNEFVSFRRAQALELSRLLLLDRPAPAPATSSWSSGLVQALQTLPDADREMLLLTHLEGLSTGAVGEALGASPPAVRQRLSRARRRLATALEALHGARRTRKG